MAEYQNDAHPRRLPAFPRQGWRAFRTEEELRVLFSEYFEYCKTEGRCPTLVGLGLWLGMTKTTFHRYAKGEYDDEVNKFSEACEEAKNFVEDDKLNNGLKGLYNPVMTKFDLGHNHGYAERKAVEITGANGGAVKHEDVSKLDPSLTPEEALRRYQEACKAAEGIASE